MPTEGKTWDTFPAKTRTKDLEGEKVPDTLFHMQRRHIFRVWLECFNRKTDEQERTASYVGTVRRSNPEKERFNMWLRFQFTPHFNTEQCIVDQ